MAIHVNLARLLLLGRVKVILVTNDIPVWSALTLEILGPQFGLMMAIIPPMVVARGLSFLTVGFGGGDWDYRVTWE